MIDRIAVLEHAMTRIRVIDVAVSPARQRYGYATGRGRVTMMETVVRRETRKQSVIGTACSAPGRDDP